MSRLKEQHRSFQSPPRKHLPGVRPKQTRTRRYPLGQPAGRAQGASPAGPARAGGARRCREVPCRRALPPAGPGSGEALQWAGAARGARHRHVQPALRLGDREANKQGKKKKRRERERSQQEKPPHAVWRTKIRLSPHASPLPGLPPPPRSRSFTPSSPL